MIKKVLFTSAVILFVFCLFLQISYGGQISFAATESAGEAVLEVNSGRLLFSRNSEKKLPMASTTKILTAILIIEDNDLDEEIHIPKEACGVEGSSIYLVPGETMTRKDLLYGLMLRSGNDCAEALAILHSGSIEKFADCMNKKAAQIGAKDSHFVNPHGLPDPQHYTTARDLAMIAAYSLRNEIFSEIVSARSYTIPDGGCGYPRLLKNKNKMLYSYEDADGVKTGFTKEAGRCLVTSETKSGMRLVSVVLNSPDMYNRSAEILNSCFDSYSIFKLFDHEKYSIELKTDVPWKKCTCSCQDDFEYPLTESEYNEISIEYCLPEKVVLPIQVGEEVGNLKVYLKNQLLFSQKIVSIEKVEKNFLDILQEIAKKGTFQDICGSINFWQSAALRADADATS